MRDTYAWAWKLCQQVGKPSQCLRVLMGLAKFDAVRGELQTTRELGEQLLSRAREARDEGFRMEAHNELGMCLFLCGEMLQERQHLTQSLELESPQRPFTFAVFHERDPSVSSLVYMAHVLWMLGYAEQAWQRAHEALSLARELSHPFSLAFVLGVTVRLYHLCRQGQVVAALVEELLALTRQHGFRYVLVQGTIYEGAVLVAQGQKEVGLAQIRQGLADCQTTGAEVLRPYYLTLLAAAYGETGQVPEGLRVLTEALEVMERTGERWWEAEIQRLTGELLLQNHRRPKVVEAETRFRRALAVARQQSAKSLELRAAMSLSRLWLRQDKRDAAHELLAAVYGGFTEGFDTADLHEAKALLTELER